MTGQISDSVGEPDKLTAEFSDCTKLQMKVNQLLIDLDSHKNAECRECENLIKKNRNRTAELVA